VYLASPLRVGLLAIREAGPQQTAESLRLHGGLLANHSIAGCSTLLLLDFGVLTTEALDASGGVNFPLLAGEKRVTVGTDFNADVAMMGAAGQKAVSAGALHAYFRIIGMGCCFHNC